MKRAPVIPADAIREGDFVSVVKFELTRFF
jgi:hypothetical protein